MSHSAHVVTPETDGVPDTRDTAFRSGTGLTYGVSWQGSRMFHFEALEDANGLREVLQTEPIHYSIGSGVRGYSYLTQHGETIYM